MPDTADAVSLSPSSSEILSSRIEDGTCDQQIDFKLGKLGGDNPNAILRDQKEMIAIVAREREKNPIASKSEKPVPLASEEGMNKCSDDGRISFEVPQKREAAECGVLLLTSHKEKIVNNIDDGSNSSAKISNDDHSNDRKSTNNNEKITEEIEEGNDSSTNPSDHDLSNDTKLISDNQEETSKMDIDIDIVSDSSTNSSNDNLFSETNLTSNDGKMTKGIVGRCATPTTSGNHGSNAKEDEVLNISLIPQADTILSDYNMMLTQNIELFKTVIEKTVNAYSKGLPMVKVGLRCIHCSSQGKHVTAASFFPSSLSSIASGIGTIGARHFIGGKCPSLSNETLDGLKQCKKISQQQTRMSGRISLDAHCRALAKREHLINLEFGGIKVCKDSDQKDKRAAAKNDVQTLKQCAAAKNKFQTLQNNDKVKTRRMTKAPSYSCTLVSDSNYCEPEIDRNNPSAFLEGALENFWECKYCKSLPYHLRASGSVVYSCGKPSLELITKHLQNCQGKKPLPVSRNSIIETKKHEDKTSVIVKWDHLNKSNRKPSRTKRRPVGGAESARKRRRLSASKLDVKEDVEDDILTTEDDKALTTDFAHFTVKQLKKCYLTKSGGSRGNCPLGYPGLACSHCASTPSARRFFYTSADHLRNSFSHIPSHLANCSKCPESVKQKISDFKVTRSKQKAQLKNGDHKKFIDGLWEKLHGPGGGIFQQDQEDETVAVEDEGCDDTSSVSSLSDDDCHADFERLKSRNSFWQDADHIPIRPSSSELVCSGDRKEVTDYMYYTMLQMVPEKVELKTVTDDSKALEMSENRIDQRQREIKSLFETKSQDDAAATNMEDSINKSDQSSAPVVERMYFTLVCRYCEGEECGKGKSSICSADELCKRFPELPKQLLSCSNCPADVKDKLSIFKGLRANQEAFLKRGAQKKFLNAIWSRLNRHYQEPARVMTSYSSVTVGEFNLAPDAINEAGLLTEADRELVTQFTFFTMEQMKPCKLQMSGNGARSMFTPGFPGLSCIHCNGTPIERNFFYRTPDILSGNYAHIPNHVLSCKHCPAQIRKELAERKKFHQEEKMQLRRGSQRVFFNNIWIRLHGKKKKA